MGIQVGQTVKVTVTCVRVFGLFCVDDDGNDMLVKIPEISWTPSFCSCEQIADVGDSFTVKILYIDKPTGQISASIRHQYKNPWIDNTLAVGTIHNAKIRRYVECADRCIDSPGHLLEIVPGSFVMLCNEPELVVGETCRVKITSRQQHGRSVSVTLLADG